MIVSQKKPTEDTIYFLFNMLNQETLNSDIKLRLLELKFVNIVVYLFIQDRITIINYDKCLLFGILSTHC